MTTNIPQPDDEQNPNDLPVPPPQKPSFFRFLGVRQTEKGKGNWILPKCNRLEKMEDEPEVEAESTSLSVDAGEEVASEGWQEVLAPETMVPPSVEELPAQEEFPPYHPWNGMFPSPTSPYGAYPPPYPMPPGYPQWPFYPHQQPQYPPYDPNVVQTTTTGGTTPIPRYYPAQQPQLPDISLKPGDRTVYFREQVTVFLDPEQRILGLIIDDKDPTKLPHGAMISEKTTVHLILLLQEYLQKLRQLPIPPISQDYL